MKNQDSRNLTVEFSLLLLLALLWGSSYVFIKIAVTEIPPLTLIAIRVTVAAVFLCVVMAIRRESMPKDAMTWRRLLMQAMLNSIGAWTVLVWGQQFIDAGLAGVLNSTTPIFVFFFTFFITKHEATNFRKLCGAVIGLGGVVLIIGVDVLQGLGQAVWGQLACLTGAVLYACSAIYGKRLSHLSALAAATGTMLWATAVLVPAALFFEDPWALHPSLNAILATGILSIFCTGIALLIYFRLLRTLGSMGVASQSFLRASVGVLLGIVLLGESFRLSIGIGLVAAVLGVALINWPARQLKASK